MLRSYSCFTFWWSYLLLTKNKRTMTRLLGLTLDEDEMREKRRQKGIRHFLPFLILLEWQYSCLVGVCMELINKNEWVIRMRSLNEYGAYKTDNMTTRLRHDVPFDWLTICSCNAFVIQDNPAFKHHYVLCHSFFSCLIVFFSLKLSMMMGCDAIFPWIIHGLGAVYSIMWKTIGWMWMYFLLKFLRMEWKRYGSFIYECE